MKFASVSLVERMPAPSEHERQDHEQRLERAAHHVMIGRRHSISAERIIKKMAHLAAKVDIHLQKANLHFAFANCQMAGGVAGRNEGQAHRPRRGRSDAQTAEQEDGPAPRRQRASLIETDVGQAHRPRRSRSDAPTPEREDGPAPRLQQEDGDGGPSAKTDVEATGGPSTRSDVDGLDGQSSSPRSPRGGRSEADYGQSSSPPS